LNLQADINSSLSLIKVHNVSDFLVKSPRIKNSCESLIEITGDRSEAVILSDIDKRKYKKLYKVSKGANKEIVKQANTFQ